MTQKEAVMFLLESFGGDVMENIRSHKNRPNDADIWMWRVAECQAEKVLKLIRPFLKVKAAEADVAFEFRKGKHFSGGKKLTEDEFAVRERLYWEMRRLKRAHKTYNGEAKYG